MSTVAKQGKLPIKLINRCLALTNQPTKVQVNINITSFAATKQTAFCFESFLN